MIRLNEAVRSEGDDLDALIEALESLAYLAMYENLPLTAHLIGVAIESIRADADSAEIHRMNGS